MRRVHWGLEDYLDLEIHTIKKKSSKIGARSKYFEFTSKIVNIFQQGSLWRRQDAILAGRQGSDGICLGKM